MVWADSSSLLKRCAYCHESVSVFEGITELGEWYHESCMIHRLLKNCLKYRKKFWDCKLTLGDCIELAEMWNLREKLLAERAEFKGIKPSLKTPTQSKMVKIKEMICCSDPLAPNRLYESVEEAKARILEDLQNGSVTNEEARDQLAELVGRARNLARQPGLKATPLLDSGKPVVTEVLTTVKEFSYEVSRPEVIRTVSDGPLRLTTAQDIQDKMNRVSDPLGSLDHPIFKLLTEEDSGDDGVEVLKRYRLPGKSISKSQSLEDEGNSGSKEDMVDFKKG